MKHFKLSLTLAAILLLMSGGCKKGSIESTDLLKTVPATATYVMVVDGEKILSDLGCEVKGDKIEAGREFEEIIDDMSRSDRESFEEFFDGNSGIDPKMFVIFSEGKNQFVTFLLQDEEKFCNLIEDETDEKFKSKDKGVKVSGQVAVKDNQAWVSLNGREVKASDIAEYVSLKLEDSFLVTPEGGRLMEAENDFRGWGNMNALLKEMFSSSELAQVKLGMGIMFDDAESFDFYVDFKNGSAEAVLSVLNDKYEKAKFNFPVKKMDTNALYTLGGSCDMLLGIMLTSDMMQQLAEYASMAGGMPSELEDAMKNVEGTVGMAMGGSYYDEAMSIVLSTNGAVSSSLIDMLESAFGSVNRDGKYLVMNKGYMSGELKVKECASLLDGAWAGAVVGGDFISNYANYRGSMDFVKAFAFTLDPKDDSMSLKIVITTPDSKENSLLTILKENL